MTLSHVRRGRRGREKEEREKPGKQPREQKVKERWVTKMAELYKKKTYVEEGSLGHRKFRVGYTSQEGPVASRD